MGYGSPSHDNLPQVTLKASIAFRSMHYTSRQAEQSFAKPLRYLLCSTPTNQSPRLLQVSDQVEEQDKPIRDSHQTLSQLMLGLSHPSEDRRINATTTTSTLEEKTNGILECISIGP
jgi:hypothetical protein